MNKSCNLAAAALLLPILSVAASAQDCKPAHTFNTIAAGELTVAAYNLLPFISVKDNSFSGVDADIINDIAKKECLSVKVVALDPAAMIQSVISGQTDIAVGDWYRTAARAEVLNLSAPIYVDQMGIVSKEGFTKASQADGKKVGTVQGYLWTADVQAAFGANATVYPNTVAMAQDLEASRIDVGFESYVVVKEAQKADAYKGMTVAVIEPDPRIAASQQPGQSNFPHTK